MPWPGVILEIWRRRDHRHRDATQLFPGSSLLPPADRLGRAQTEIGEEGGFTLKAGTAMLSRSVTGRVFWVEDRSPCPTGLGAVRRSSGPSAARTAPWGMAAPFAIRSRRARRRPESVQASPARSMFRPAPSSRPSDSSRRDPQAATSFSSEARRVNRMLQTFVGHGLKLGLGLLDRPRVGRHPNCAAG